MGPGWDVVMVQRMSFAPHPESKPCKLLLGLVLMGAGVYPRHIPAMEPYPKGQTAFQVQRSKCLQPSPSLQIGSC